jgi:hypothetical protein
MLCLVNKITPLLTYQPLHKLIAVLSCLPNTTYDLPAGDGLDDLIVSADQADPSGKPNAGKSYVIFGKQDNTAINLSIIVAGIGGFVINGESTSDYSSSVSSAGDVNGDGLDDLSLPTPALKTSIPPLPVRVSLPAPATKISFLLVVVLVRVLSSLLPR